MNSHVLDFDDMFATILINRTKRSFVVPRNCFYCVSRAGYDNYVMPISPRAALLLLPKAQLKGEIGNYGVIDSEEQIFRLNKYALHYECAFNRKFVASDSRYELECLQKILMK